MKDLYDPQTVTEIKNRLARLLPDTPHQWGSMNPAQMLAHCAAWMEMACGDTAPKRSLIGRIVGPIAKKKVLGEQAIPRNMPTEKSLLTNDAHDFGTERRRFLASVERFAAGPENCTRHHHCFFGSLTPSEWSRLARKHLDHHFQQFGI